MIVMKFGGTSVGSAKAIRRVADIIKSRLDQQPAVVTSAMGGITDSLVSLAEEAGQGRRNEVDALLDGIIDKHRKVIADLDIVADVTFIEEFEKGIQQLKEVVEKIFVNGSLTLQYYDALISMGEYFMAHILSAFLTKKNIPGQMVDSRRLLRTDSTYSAARPHYQESKSNVLKYLLPVIQQGKIPVIQGFTGKSKKGKTTTLGRGGSDYSATLFGSMLGVDTVEIWSDVDGVLTADPSLVSDAHRIRHMSFHEAAELAYFGAKVLHPATLVPAIENDITVVVLNSMNPDFHGTAIANTSPVDLLHEGRVKSIAYKEELTVITVSSSRMLMAHGFMALLFSIFEKYETAVDLVSTSEVTVSLTIDNIQRLDLIVPELEKFATVNVEKYKAIVCLVGEGLKRTKGIPGRIFGLLQDTHIYSISQGASEINLSFVIDQDDLPKVITRLHDYFFANDLDPAIFSVSE